MPIYQWGGDLQYIPWIPMLFAGALLLVVFGACFATATLQLKWHASLLAKQLNQEAERRHQETVAALQDIAKAIRECNEE